MEKYRKVGRASLWKAENTGNGPSLRGEIDVDGVQYRLSLWRNESEHDRAPILKGTIESIGEN